MPASASTLHALGQTILLPSIARECACMVWSLASPAGADCRMPAAWQRGPNATEVNCAPWPEWWITPSGRREPARGSVSSSAGRRRSSADMVKQTATTRFRPQAAARQRVLLPSRSRFGAPARTLLWIRSMTGCRRSLLTAVQVDLRRLMPTRHACRNSGIEGRCFAGLPCSVSGSSHHVGNCAPSPRNRGMPPPQGCTEQAS